MKLFSKNSNLCDHNSPTLQTDRQTDRQTDDMRSQYRALHRAVKITKNYGWNFMGATVFLKLTRNFWIFWGIKPTYDTKQGRIRVVLRLLRH